MLLALLLILVLVCVNGILSGTEMALVTLKDHQLKKLEDTSPKGKEMIQMLRNPTRFLAVIQIGITLAGFLASAIAALAISEPIGEFAGDMFFPFGGLAALFSLLAVTVILSFISLVFGELVPKRIALHYPEKWATKTMPLLILLNRLVSPLVALLSIVTEKTVRTLGIKDDDGIKEINRQELRDTILGNQAITDDHRNIMRGAFEISERRLGKVACPRQDVVSIKADMKCEDAIRTIQELSFSRVPVCETEDLDTVVGVVHLRDLLKANRSDHVKTCARDVPFYPESSKVLTVMQAMQASRTNMAMVINEHGGIAGIVTLEDLVEEIVGEIYDDYDKATVQPQEQKADELVLPGAFPLYDLPEMGVEVEDGPYSTLAGFMLHHLGELPANSDQTLIYQDYVFAATRIDKRRIEEVTITRRET